ncbi:23S rRNA m(5)U-1939 methyltransferase [Desulfonatronum thiosulfatophilum]|uniref:23S rRNA m(5)U-1939 methyltransferase n=1 Tax=Desulfonatronum thiosulfatophilum TaxID=617002 RepID=A0A1G6BDI0_9BACT|nr:23S rRNA (uracil(1939)-C(5))-methyltransferase RlmD [Desulfonatronum thiosulfatophilum]SDB18636.1 23S rRNA m(5)U-1939 methyltransferase [Desulfonatronum thiosulfatophilum]
MQIEPGQELILEVLKPTLGGDGLARHEGMAVFVPGVVPGQRVLARVASVKARHAKAELLEVVEQSAEHVPPGCPHFGVCGGCDWLHMEYGRQLHWKRELVRETLRHIGGVDAVVAPTIASPVTRGYRNKMEFAFSPQAVMPKRTDDSSKNTFAVSTGPAIGMRPRNMANLTTPIRTCLLCPQEMVDVQDIVGRWAANSGLDAYDPNTGKGFWRHLVLRRGDDPNYLMACLITSHDPRGEDMGPRLAEHFVSHAPQVKTVVHEVRRGRSLVAQGERVISVTGPDELLYELGGMTLAISSRSFFQTNTHSADRLYEVVRDFAGLSGRETLWDLYSGVGALALYLARGASEVLGFEMEPAAVRNAEANAARNARSLPRTRCRFLAGDVARTIPRAISDNLTKKPDVIVADPPRAGMQPAIIARLLEIGAPKLILVSCNPATLARDVKSLSSLYVSGRIQPVDMFPHTSHIECVAELSSR